MTDRINPNPEARNAEDSLPTRKVALVGAGALLVFLVGVLGAWDILAVGRRADQPRGPPAIPPNVQSQQVGIVFQPMFGQLQDGALLRDAQLEQLSSYGWVDRPRGVIHLPIERAMELFLAGRKP
jgi:hypothetical protein